MSDDLLGLVFDDPDQPPPTGHPGRFGGRWRLVDAGLADVWRYGDLRLSAPSGRLLMRGPNGTGKTTALEVLWPYVLDLNAAKLGAGKARFTSLKLLMSEGATSKRRYGYVWLTFAPPHDAATGEQLIGAEVTYGVRLQYAEGASPAVRPIPFMVPARPLDDVPLRGPHHEALELEQFIEAVVRVGGQVFADDEEAYVNHLAWHVWGTTPGEVRLLADRLRQVRNPSLLSDLSPAAAANALRASLPGVSEDVVAATAEALAESDATREAFARDTQAARVLADFAGTWAGHVTDIVRTLHTTALDKATVVGQHAEERDRLRHALTQATTRRDEAARKLRWLTEQKQQADSQLAALEQSEAYKAGGRLADLEQTAHAQRERADGELALLAQRANSARQTTDAQQAAADDLVVDVTALCEPAVAAGAPAVAVGALLAVGLRPRSTHTVGDRTVDPGPGVTVNHDVPAIAGLPAAWRQTAAEHTRRADRATVALTTHTSVQAARVKAEAARTAETAAEQDVDRHVREVAGLEQAAAAAAAAALTVVGAWAQANDDLRTPDVPDAGDSDNGNGTTAADVTALPAQPDDERDLEGWSSPDVDALRTAEPALVLTSLDTWAALSVQLAEQRAAATDQQARTLTEQARQDRKLAGEHRQLAARYRRGQLLPLPRPAWAAAADGEESRALGTALEWRTDADSATGLERQALDRMETALAASGLLGASVEDDDAGAVTEAWRVVSSTAVVTPNLTDVLTADPQHPRAKQVRAVLERVALADTANAASASSAAVVIGRDGTFRAGPLLGDPVAALGEAGVPTAKHVGSRQRRAQALREADRLDEAADELELGARALDQQARELRADAATLRTRGGRFPSRQQLRDSEAARATAAGRTSVLELARIQAQQARERDTAAYYDERDAWLHDTRAAGLPTDVHDLTAERDGSREHAQTIITLAAQLERTLLPRLRRLVAALVDETALADELARLAGIARTSHATAAGTEHKLAELRANAGRDIAAAQQRHAELIGQREKATEELDPATEKVRGADAQHARLEAALAQAELKLTGAQPDARASAHRLRLLLGQRAVAQVVLASGQLADNDDALLDQVDQLLRGRRTTPRHLVGQRYDTARAELALTWTLARADAVPDLPELDLYVATHQDVEYAPAAAAAHAAELAARAEQQLAAAEQDALTRFVIGRLPSAIGTAWVELRDWKLEVNAKMRSAEASSGVGVQVEIDLLDDLSAATRTVYELCCKTDDAHRTPEQRAEVGAALQSLIHAADGDTMLERVSAAVDIREWVDVHYVVTRPGRKSGRWNQRTGLSGGERRLVVLAPMLAAVAAAYDKFGPTGLRLAALDEVPAEVDERGREGLARFIADLDLDLVCTSYLWDGAPGAWDGIDAHDLEVAPDGIVVSYPMLVRGLLDLPGDEKVPHGQARR